MRGGRRGGLWSEEEIASSETGSERAQGRERSRGDPSASQGPRDSASAAGHPRPAHPVPSPSLPSGFSLARLPVVPAEHLAQALLAGDGASPRLVDQFSVQEDAVSVEDAQGGPHVALRPED